MHDPTPGHDRRVLADPNRSFSQCGGFHQWCRVWHAPARLACAVALRARRQQSLLLVRLMGRAQAAKVHALVPWLWEGWRVFTCLYDACCSAAALCCGVSISHYHFTHELPAACRVSS